MAEQVLSRLAEMLDLPVKKIRSRSREHAVLRLPAQADRRVRPRGGRVRDPRAPGGVPRRAGAEHQRPRVPHGADGIARGGIGRSGATCAARPGARSGSTAPTTQQARRVSRPSTSEWLRGRKGLQRYVVNSDGERIRDLGGREPTAGGDLVLTLDSAWQRAAEDYLRESIFKTRQVLDEDRGTYYKADAGVVVVLDVETGGRQGDGVVARLRPAVVRDRADEGPTLLPRIRRRSARGLMKLRHC